MSAGEPVRWGVISTADIGIAKVLPAMQQAENLVIAAIASRDAARARSCADLLGIETSYGSYEELLADDTIEAIYNPLPNAMHVDWTIRAAEAGKHVLCEKPVGLNAAEVDQLIEARERTGRLIQEAFMVRHHPQWHRVRELVRSGALGELRAIQVAFSYMNRDAGDIRNIPEQGGGALYDIGCYPITTARFVSDAEPTQVVALIDRDPEFGTDRLTSALLDFPWGQASFVCSTQLVAHQRFTLFGTERRLAVEIPYNTPGDRPARLILDDGAQLGDASAVAEELPAADQYRLQGANFSAAIRSGERAREVALEDSRANMRVIDAVFRSAESGAWEAV